MKYLMLLAMLTLWLISSSVTSISIAQTDRPLSEYPVITADNVHLLQQVRAVGEGFINDIIFSSDEQYAATATTAGIWLYSIDDLQTPIRLFGDYAIDVTYAMFSPDGNRLFGGVQGGSVYIWDVASGDLLNVLDDTNDQMYNNAVLGMELSDDGNLLYVIVSSYLVIWNLTDNTEVKQIQLYQRCESRGHINEKYIHILSPDKNYILLSCYWNYRTYDYTDYFSKTDLVSIETGEMYPIEADNFDLEEGVHNAHFNDSGTRIIIQLGSGFFEIWDTESKTRLYRFGEELRGYKPSSHDNYAKNASPTSQQANRLFNKRYPLRGILTDDETKFIELNGYGLMWDIATNTATVLFTMQANAKRDEPFNPYQTVSLGVHIDESEAQEILEYYDVIHRVALYLHLWNEIGQISIHSVFPSPQFKHFVVANNAVVIIWDVESGNKIFELDLHSPCRYVSGNILSLQNTRLIYKYNNGSCVFDVQNGTLLYALSGIASYLVGCSR